MMGIDPQRPGQMLTYGVFCHIESWIPGPDGTVSAVIAAGEMVELIGLGEDDEKEHSNDDSPNQSKDDSANQLESNLKSGTSSGVGSSSGRRSASSAPTELVEARVRLIDLRRPAVLPPEEQPTSELRSLGTSLSELVDQWTDLVRCTGRERSEGQLHKVPAAPYMTLHLPTPPYPTPYPTLPHQKGGDRSRSDASP